MWSPNHSAQQSQSRARAPRTVGSKSPDTKVGVQRTTSAIQVTLDNSVAMIEVKNAPDTDADITAQTVDKFLSHFRVKLTNLVDMSTEPQLTIALARSTKFAEHFIIDLDELLKKSQQDDEACGQKKCRTCKINCLRSNLDKSAGVPDIAIVVYHVWSRQKMHLNHSSKHDLGLLWLLRCVSTCAWYTLMACVYFFFKSCYSWRMVEQVSSIKTSLCFGAYSL